MSKKRKGELREATTNLICVLDETIDGKEKELESLRSERGLLQRKLDQED